MWMFNQELLVLHFLVACIACQPFTAPVEICPGDSPQFTCTVEDATNVSITVWIVTVNGTVVNCIHAHSFLENTTCGPNNEFESSPSGRDGNNFTSTLTTMSSISPSLNGTSVRCAGLTPTNVIGSDLICITGGSSIPPQISSAVISEAGVSENECVVTVSWSEPVISCNGSISQYILTVSPNTTECQSGRCQVGRGEEKFEKRQQNFTLTAEQMYLFNVRADTCKNTQTGQDSDQYTILMEATPSSCEYYYNFIGSSFDIDTINITWKMINLSVSGEIQYSLIISPGGQRVSISLDDCNSTHCSYAYTINGSETDYNVSVEAVGCVNRTTACQNISSRCNPADLIEGLNVTNSNATCYMFPEGEVCYTGISEDSIAIYSSNNEYSLNDTSSIHRKCMNGSWTGQVPIFVPITAEPPTVSTPVKMTGVELTLIVIGFIVFIVGYCVGASIGMVLFLRANNIFGGFLAILILIVCVLGLPVALIVYCIMKRKGLDEEKVHLVLVSKFMLCIAVVFSAVPFVLWIVLLVYSLTQDFVEDENDTEIKIRHILIILWFVFSVVMTPMWGVCTALWKCFATTSGKEDSDSPPPKPQRSRKSKYPAQNAEKKMQCHFSMAPARPVTEPIMSSIDKSIDPEQIQLYLVVVRPQWRRVGSAVGLSPQFLNEVLSNYEEDKDRLAEVVYEWCSRVQNIRWGDVAAMCRNIGHSDLANALDKVYQTDIPTQDPKTSPNELYELKKPMKCTDNKAYQTISAPGTK